MHLPLPLHNLSALCDGSNAARHPKFKPRVIEEIRKLHEAEHPRTIEFYEQTFNRVLSFRPLAKANLTDIEHTFENRE